MQALVSLFILPLMLLNWFGGIASGIWLAILGEWSAVGVGIAAIFISHWVLGFLMMPGLIFGGPAMFLLERGKTILAMPLIFLSQLYTYGVITLWCIFVFAYFLKGASYQSFWPMLIWSYGVALGPLMYLAQKEQNEASTMTTFFAQIAYVIMCLAVIFRGGTLLELGTVFVAIMGIGMLIQTIVAIAVLRMEKKLGTL